MVTRDLPQRDQTDPRWAGAIDRIHITQALLTSEHHELALRFTFKLEVKDLLLFPVE